jgi:hypothetical protein
MYPERGADENAVRDAPETYDYHVLQGHIIEHAALDERLNNLLDEKLVGATARLEKSKARKGLEKTLAGIDAFILFSSAVALMNGCEIRDDGALFAFLCVRMPELEFDWATLQRMLNLREKASYGQKAEEDKNLDLAITLYTSALLGELKKRVK